MSQRSDWEQLAGIAGILRDRDLSRVEGIVRHMNRIRSDIATLEEAREAGSRRGLDTARLTGADVAWMAWSQERLVRLQAQLAALRASHELALAEARRAFGRADVARRISRGEVD